jgi:hypothetical protein
MAIIPFPFFPYDASILIVSFSLTHQKRRDGVFAIGALEIFRATMPPQRSIRRENGGKWGQLPIFHEK